MRAGNHGLVWTVVVLAIALAVACPAFGQSAACGAPAEPPCPQTAPQYGVAPTIHLPPAMAYHQKQERAALRQRKLKEASARLFLLAQQLRAEISKTNQNTLSLQVIRKAKQIEKLARQIQQTMARGTD